MSKTPGRRLIHDGSMCLARESCCVRHRKDCVVYLEFLTRRRRFCVVIVSYWPRTVAPQQSKMQQYCQGVSGVRKWGWLVDNLLKLWCSTCISFMQLAVRLAYIESNTDMQPFIVVAETASGCCSHTAATSPHHVIVAVMHVQCCGRGFAFEKTVS